MNYTIPTGEILHSHDSLLFNLSNSKDYSLEIKRGNVFVITCTTLQSVFPVDMPIAIEVCFTLIYINF